MKLVLATVVALSAPFSAQASLEDSYVNAVQMCRWLDSLDLLTGKCAVSVKATSVDVRIATTAGEAKQICKSISDTMRSDGVKFDRGWKLRIANSGNKRIAQCGL